MVNGSEHIVNGSEHIVSGSEYCTTKTQSALEDGGARRQSGSQSHTDFDLAPFTSSRDNNISKVVWACHDTSAHLASRFFIIFIKQPKCTPRTSRLGELGSTRAFFVFF